MTALDTVLFTDLPLYHLSIEQYHGLIAAGVLGPEDRVELLNGCLVTKMSNNPPDASATELTVDAMRSVVPAGYYVRSEKPITLRGDHSNDMDPSGEAVLVASDSEPEPDVAIVVGTPRDYTSRHPGPADIQIVVEISDSTLSRDRTKKQIYASAGIGCYWIVDVTGRNVEVSTNPRGSAYTSSAVFHDKVPVTICGKQIAMIDVSDLLP